MDGKPNGFSHLAGGKPDKVADDRSFPVRTLEDVLSQIRRAGGTGKLEIHFKNGHARGDAKWQGVVREN